MNSSKWDETLSRVAEETFASLAFLLPAFDELPDDPDEPRTAARVSFTGPMSGTLILSMPTASLEELAANMLGIAPDEPPPDETQQADALRELLNVVCGNLLPEIAGAEAVFNVGAPELHEGAELPDTYQGRPRTATARSCLEAGWTELALYVDQQAPAAAL